MPRLSPEELEVAQAEEQESSTKEAAQFTKELVEYFIVARKPYKNLTVGSYVFVALNLAAKFVASAAMSKEKTERRDAIEDCFAHFRGLVEAELSHYESIEDSLGPDLMREALKTFARAKGYL